MGTNLALYDEYSNHEDFIDMELTSSPQNREFEFQMSSIHDHNQETTADELFHDGKLLPLHLLRHPSTTTAAAAEITKNPSEERQYHHSNTTPSESHKQSSKKQKLIKSSLIFAQKLKSLKTLFQKHVCSDNPAKHGNCNRGPGISSDYDVGQRRSFSGAIKRRYPVKCSSSSSSSSSLSSSSSSSFSFRSNGAHEFDFLRSSSSFREIEASIDAAIAHCKNSREEVQKRRDVC